MTSPRENFCRICLKAAASNTLNGNFGPNPNPATHLCAEHLEQFHNSSEFKSYIVRRDGVNHHLPDFCNRISKEEEVIKERARRAQAEQDAKVKAEAEKAAEKKPEVKA